MVRIPKRKNRLVVGLTGVFGSGKTSVATLFKKLGAHVIDCDAIVRDIYETGNPLLKKIGMKFGLRNPNRMKLGALVFSDARKRHQLEKLIHPYVFQKISENLKRVKHGIVVIDMPLLFEVGFERNVEKVVVVASQSQEIRKRLMKKGFSSGEIVKRLGAQMPLREKVKRSDFIINNSGGLENLKKQVQKVLNNLKQSSYMS